MGGLLREMDAAGVERSVLAGWYWERPETCAMQNRFYAACVRAHPERLMGLATFHPSDAESALAEVRRAREEGLCGLGELSPHSQGFPADDPVFLEALSLASDLRLPIVLHTTDPEGRRYPGRIETPMEDFVRLGRAFPGVAFVLSHWGALLPLRRPEAAALGNLHYDTAASPLLYDAGIWERFVAAVGAERVLFGSDFPLNNYPALDAEPGMTRLVAEARRIGPAHLDAVLGGNARKLFCNGL